MPVHFDVSRLISVLYRCAMAHVSEIVLQKAPLLFVCQGRMCEFGEVGHRFVGVQSGIQSNPM